MKTPKLADALCYLDEDLISDAADYTPHPVRFPGWAKWTAAAACLALLLLAALPFPTVDQGPALATEETARPAEDRIPAFTAEETAPGATSAEISPPAPEAGPGIVTETVLLPDPSEGEGVEYDMIGCLFYQGHVYTQSFCYHAYGFSEALDDLRDTYLGKATGSLNVWSTQDEWAEEFASTYRGDVYTVKGYSPDFRLSIWVDTEDGGFLELLDNYDHISLRTGADLFEKRLSLRERLSSVAWLTHSEWNQSDADTVPQRALDVPEEQWNAFLDALDAGPFEQIDCDTHPEFYRTGKQGHLFLFMTDGTYVELRLIEGGYVGSQAFPWYFVRVPEELFNVILEACQ